MKKLGFLFALIAVLAIAGSALAAPVAVLDIPGAGERATRTISLDKSPTAVSDEIRMYLGEMPQLRATYNLAEIIATEPTFKAPEGAVVAGYIVKPVSPVSVDIWFFEGVKVGSKDVINIVAVSKDAGKSTNVASIDITVTAVSPILSTKTSDEVTFKTPYAPILTSVDVSNYAKIGYAASPDAKYVTVKSFDISGVSHGVVSAGWNATSKNIIVSVDATNASRDIIGSVKALVEVPYTGLDGAGEDKGNIKRNVTELLTFKVEAIYPPTPKTPEKVTIKKAEELLSNDFVLFSQDFKEKDGTVYFDRNKLHKEKDGSFVLDNVSYDVGKMVEVPGFTTSVDKGTKAIVVLSVDMTAIPEVSRDKIAELTVFKKVLVGSRADFKTLELITGTPTKDGECSLSGTPKHPKEYNLTAVIADNGTYDLAKADQIIFDPMLIGVKNTKGGSSSGGGCTAAYAPFALILAAPLFFLRKKD